MLSDRADQIFIPLGLSAVRAGTSQFLCVPPTGLFWQILFSRFREHPNSVLGAVFAYVHDFSRPFQ